MLACSASQPLSTDWAQINVPQYGSELDEVDDCGTGGRFQVIYSGNGTTGRSDVGEWATTVPPDLTLTSFSVPSDGVLINPDTQNNLGSSGYNVRYLWLGGSYKLTDTGSCCGGMDHSGAATGALTGRYFIVQVACNLNSCEPGANDPYQIVDVKNLTLVAEDDTPPSLTIPPTAGSGTNLAAAGEYVRGAFGLAFHADNSNASGVCSMAAVINGAWQPTVVSVAPDPTKWVQCPATGDWSQTVDTSAYPDGNLTIIMRAADAATPSNLATFTKGVVVDNAPVSVTLSGPSDVPAPTPDTLASVHVAALAGPSGVAGIFCSVDKGRYTEEPGAAEDLSITGLGLHEVDCYAQNKALDASGVPARSPLQTMELEIRSTTAEAISFRRIIGLRCREVTERVRLPGRTRVVRRHGRLVRVSGRSRVVRERVRRCRTRTARRRITVFVMRHGRRVKVHRVVVVALPPKAVSLSHIRVAYGRSTTVSGYLGLTNGTPLADRPVQIVAVAANGLGQVVPFAEVTTSASGTWTARVPAGPSRLIEARYGGSSTEEPAVSAPVELTVPAKIRLLRVTPRVPWGGTVRIVGKLYGGYLPRSGALVRLRYGFGRRARVTFGVVQHVTGRGIFRTFFTFGPGPPALHVRYWFSASLLPHSDYPYAAASSPRRYVLVGGPARLRRRGG